MLFDNAQRQPPAPADMRQLFQKSHNGRETLMNTGKE